MPFPNSARIFTERHIQLPVKTVFYSPMTANGIRKAFTRDLIEAECSIEFPYALFLAGW